MTTSSVQKSENLVSMPSWSPSRLEDIESCPCFAYVEAMEVTDTAATEGLLMHEAAETGDLSKLENDEQRAEVQMALDYVQGILSGYGDRVQTVLREQPIRIGILRRNGKMDVVIEHKPLENLIAQVDIVDYKFGRKPVTPADHNMQMLAYALGAFDAYEHIGAVRVHIVAPRSKDVSNFTYTRAMVPTMQLRVRKALDTFFDPFKRPCSRSPDLCERCANVARCPEMAGTATALAKVLGLPMPKDLDLSVDSKIDPEDRMRCQVLALAMLSWAEQVKRANTNYVNAGGVIPYFSMRTRGGAYKIKDVDAAWASLLLHGFTDADVKTAVSGLSTKTLVEIYAQRAGVDPKVAKAAVIDAVGPAGEMGASASWLQRDKKLPWEQLGTGTQALLTAPKEDKTEE